MDEFRDDISHQFVEKFKNFKEDGFTKSKWDDYIIDMIKMDKHDVNVTMTPPKSYKVANNFAPDANIRVQYAAKIGKYHYNYIIHLYYIFTFYIIYF
jgi:hypothetical protein